MSHRFTPWAVTGLALLVLLLGAGLADAQRGKGGTGNNKKSASRSKKAETYAVVKVGDTYQAVAKSELKSFKKSVSERYREELKAYNAAKKAAAKAKEKFNQPKPKAPKVSVVKKGLKSETDARALAERLTERQRNRASATKDKAARPKAESWVVADVDGSLRVMRKSEMLDAKKKADAAYRTAMKEWNAAKKAAAKKKTRFNEPRPRKSIVKPVGGSFKTEEAARKHCDKLQEKKSKRAARGKSDS
jgi:hypothetical protein